MNLLERVTTYYCAFSSAKHYYTSIEKRLEIRDDLSAYINSGDVKYNKFWHKFCLFLVRTPLVRWPIKNFPQPNLGDTLSYFDVYMMY